MGLSDPGVGGIAILYSVTPRDTASHPERLESRGGSKFCGRQAYTIFGTLFKKKTTKLRTKVNIHMYCIIQVSLKSDKKNVYFSIIIHF
jgi:hypothetical protein